MGKPRLIILIRHAQSEGNKNREIHQMIPDHRVKLTSEGWKQAEEAGRRLRKLLRPDDTLQIFTSPYRRTRETTEGILKTLTARDDPDDPDASPSPFSRSKITVYEEPRIREQDFGNFQPCSAEMERMWAERADYGHFFYRIPNGESAADAYDRIAGFNESLWRQFGDAEFPSVCVLVTHGLMTRIFLMKWYHWSVEYFEDLRNMNHCEFVLMNKNPDNGKYVLENNLRTWSELKRQRQEENNQGTNHNLPKRNTLTNFLSLSAESPVIPQRKWGGCAAGCNHEHDLYPRRAAQLKQEAQSDLNLPPAAEDEQEDASKHKIHAGLPKGLALTLQHESDNDGGTPHERSEDESSSYFRSNTGRAIDIAQRKSPMRKATPKDIERWASESGMGTGQKADALGDEPSNDDDQSADDLEEAEREDKSLHGSVY